ncbi:hypothetical protein LOZ80_00050 [Paenibacillus sp. HWE-109]|uniref:hypothetical protein n=1 Tax=Paenibacillus sp. HWE-109 TaxID=1306526 RepID=UPI001EDF084C|nr:hypothetical protein [Paenibacillus sp. HWE-109]UKS27384.1 hypothetical protein LOZ80_00050 [Paenibacillus sp. HWE-109]
MIKSLNGISSYFKICVMLLLVILASVGCSAKSNLTDKIIKEIDGECGENGTCTISIKEVTDFEWDRMVIFQIGSSKSEISKALGIEYSGPTDMMTGMIFVKDNKIVHEEIIPYYPEKPSKLWIVLDKTPKEPNCISFMVDNAVLKGIKKKDDNQFYYRITNEKE